MTLIGTAISMASGFAQMSAQQQMVDATNKANNDAFAISKNAREAELTRQKSYENQAANSWADANNKLAQPQYEADKQAAANDFMDRYDTMGKVLTDGQLLSGQETASNEVKTEIAARTSRAAADARARVQALAALSGSDNATNNRAFALQGNADALGGINTLRRGSLAVSNQEQNISPVQISQGSSAMGDILSGTGAALTKRGGYNSTVNG
jgi:hypothetical protein